MPRTKAARSVSPPKDDDAFRLVVSYTTDTYGPPHSITVRDSAHDWADVVMSCTQSEGRAEWTADLVSPAGEGPIYIEFKLVLDGHTWMSGWNQSGTTDKPAAYLSYDDGSVVWESDPVDDASEESFPASDPPSTY
jgi:hypothetical protein